MALEIIFMVAGGLGIFLLGMKNMSEGMQAVAGRRLRRLIGAITNNRIMACGVGTIVTCILQSSSITTVMVVGMVNAGIMNLVQAIGVILGANIGTTITGWILVLKISKYGLPILGVATFFFLFSKREKVRFTASFFLGLGMIFYGLQLMKNGFAPLKEMEGFIAWFSRFDPDTGYLGVLKCCLVGAILTAIVQSSSATLGITIGLAFSGVIDYHTAAALVLGENIGTTITTYLASLGATRNAKRAAYAHMLVNIFGVLWITLIFRQYVGWVERFIEYSSGFLPSVADADGNYPYSTAAIATTHTGFNVVNVIVILPFIAFVSKFLYKMVPEEAVPEPAHLTFLDIRMLDTPAIGIQQSQKEIHKMSGSVADMFGPLRESLEAKEVSDRTSEKIFEAERKMDMVQMEIVQFVGSLMSGNISHNIVNEGRKQLRMADEYESISDYVTAILKLRLKISDTNQIISEAGLKDLLSLHGLVFKYINLINESVERSVGDFFLEAQIRGEAITHLMKDFRASHLERVGTGDTTPLKSLIYTDMLNAYRRIKDHAFNIAEIIAGEK